MKLSEPTERKLKIAYKVVNIIGYVVGICLSISLIMEEAEELKKLL